MKKRRRPRWFILIVLIVIVNYFYILYEQQKMIDSKKAQLNEIQAKIAEETENNEYLKKEKEMVLTDEYIEKIARERLGLISPGEKIYVDVNR